MSTTVSTGSAASDVGWRKGRQLGKEKLAELKKSFTKNIAQNADMNNELQSEAIDLIISAVDKQKGNYEAAARSVKEQMDRKFGPSWHCIIGEGFGFQCTYETSHMIYLFYQGNVGILLFKC
jgi:dynein light chain 4